MNCQDNNKPCDEEVNSMTPKEVCVEKQKRKKEIVESIGDIIVAPAKLGLEVIKLLTGTADTKSEVINRIRNKLRSEQITKLKQVCENQVILSGSNIIDGTPCEESYKELLEQGFISSEQYMKLKENIVIDGVVQIIDTKVKNSCAFRAVSEMLSNMDNSIDNQAFLEVMAESQGILSSANTDTKVCNDISTDISSCNYLSNNQCCLNKAIISQENIIKTCGKVSNVLQKSREEVINQCMGVTDTKVKSDQKSSTINKIEVEASSKSVGVTAAFLAMVVVIIILIFLFPTIVTATTKSKGVRIVIFILSIIILIGLGIFLIVKFNKSKRKEVNKSLFHIVGCKDTKVKSKNPEKGDESKAKSKLENSDDILGYDIVMDDEGSNIYYITDYKVDKNGDYVCDIKTDMSEVGGKTYLKKYQENLYLYLAITCFVLALLFVIVSIVIMVKKPKIETSNSVNNESKNNLKIDDLIKMKLMKSL
jgi:hypothetical protein